MMATSSAQTQSQNGGRYEFCDLDGGDYIVVVLSSNFEAGGPLEGYSSSLGDTPAGDPDDDVNDQDDGAPLPSGSVASRAITLECGAEPDKPIDGDGINGNLTLDFGFSCPLELCLGNLVFYDPDNDGLFEPLDGEFGIVGVLMNLYRDTDGSGDLTVGDALLDSLMTGADGLYQFCGLAPGEYIVEIDKLNFEPGEILYGSESSAGNDVMGSAPDPDDDLDDDDNGSPRIDFGVASKAVTLAPLTEPDTPVDGDDTNGNLTVDFGIKDVDDPTGVSMGGFSATVDTASALSVSLQWWTTGESDIAGFHLYRAAGEGGTFERVNAAMIPARGERGGASYRYLDPIGRAGAYRYRLEVIDLDGVARNFGPVRVDLRGGAARPVYLPALHTR